MPGSIDLDEGRFVSLAVLRSTTVGPVWFEDRLWTWIDRLPPNYKRIVVLRYGLIGNGFHTLEEIGQELGISRERVRQLENRSLFLLRQFAYEKPDLTITSIRSMTGSMDRDAALAPVGLRAKFRSDYLQRQLAKLTVRVRAKRFSKKYIRELERYQFSQATNEPKLFYRAGLWIGVGKNWWVCFTLDTALGRMGVDPSELRRVLRLTFGKIA